MKPVEETISLFDSLAAWNRRTMKSLSLAIVSVPLVFATPTIMDVGYEVPKVTLYRTLVGLMAVLWIVEWGLPGR